MNKLLKSFCGVIAGTVFAVSIQAAPLTYVEVADLSTDPSIADPLGTLDVGLNTVGGSIDTLSGDFLDNWSASLAIGTVITDIIVEISGFSSLFIGGEGIAIFGNGSNNDLISTFTGNGTYSVDGEIPADFFSDFIIADNGSAVVAFDYIWKITVDDDTGSVPAPAGILLLLGGLGLIGLGKARQ